MLLSPRTLHTYIFNYSLLRSNKSWEPPAQASKFRKWTAPQPTSHISSAWHESLMTWYSYIFLTFWWFPRLFVNHQCHQQLPHIPNSTTTKFALFVTDTLICAKQNISFSYISYVSLCLLALCSHLFLHRCVSHPSIIHSRLHPHGEVQEIQWASRGSETTGRLFLWPSDVRSHLTSSNHNLKVRGRKWCGISVLNSQLDLERYFQACHVQILRVTLSNRVGETEISTAHTFVDTWTSGCPRSPKSQFQFPSNPRYSQGWNKVVGGFNRFNRFHPSQHQPTWVN